MNCPDCSRPLPDQARYCPSCGTGVEVAARLDVRVDVEHNSGRVVGVQTDAIHGDVFGGDIYQVQVYVLSETSRTQSGLGAAGLATGPYKFLSAYTPLDRAIFKGRQAEIEQAVRRVGEGRLLVLYGPAGVGKTSLLAAGVIPELIGAGALAIHIRDYSRPLGEALRTALQGSQTQLAISLPDGEDLPALLVNLHKQLSGTLVLVLDQFESLFREHTDPQMYAQIMNELVGSLRQVEPEYLRLILSIEDNALVRLSDLQQALPDVFRSFMQLNPLDPVQARAAILEPLVAFKSPPVYYQSEFVDSLLIPDLIELSPEMSQAIYPPHLQIVCHHLFERAIKLSPPLIDQNLYLHQAGGAEGILAGFLDETLRLRLGAEAGQCNQCLVALATAGARAWVAAEELMIDGLEPSQIQAGLERLEQAGLLISRLNQQRVEFAFTSPIVAQEVRKMAGPEIEIQGLARADLERGWAGWLAHGDLISSRQLRRIITAGHQLKPGVLHSLLLIRSALAFGFSPAGWLPGLEDNEALTIIGTLEGTPPANSDMHPSLSRLVQAKTILGIDSAQQTASFEAGYGLLAKTAVHHPDPSIRGTAALALQAPDQHQALSRLDWALGGLPGSFNRLQRKSELRGLLADEIPKFHTLNQALPLAQRIGIWLWRLWRTLRRERYALLWITMGAAVGAGIGLSVWRGLVAWLAGSPVPGFLSFVHLIYGILLGAGLSLGVSLGRVLGLEKLTSQIEPTRTPKPSWLPALLGGIGFGIAHAWIFVLNGGVLLSGNLVVVWMGMLAGLGLSAVLVRPMIGYSQAKTKATWMSVVIGGLSFALLQLAIGGLAQRSLAISYPERAYQADFSRFAVFEPVKSLMDAIPAWPMLLSVIDAAIVGGLLAAGILTGVRIASHFLTKFTDGS